MNRKTSTRSAIGMGIPTILSIFIILMMCILSMLTYLKANTIKSATDKEIELTRNYYEADYKAKMILEANDDDLSFTIEINNELLLKVSRTDGTVEEYRIIKAGE